jgi:glyoxylase-like metal-dependent hydrolase (beta-lactamase superfamily II)
VSSSADLRVLVETVGPFAENAYFLVDPESRQTAAIDPGDEPERLLEIVRAERLDVRWILGTHCHIDHVGAVAALKEATGAPYHIHAADRFLLDGVPEQAALFGLLPPPIPEVDGYIEEGSLFHLGPSRIPIRTVETPGHSPGSVSFLVGDAIFSGDALFHGGIGRWDLPGGSLPALLESIREKLLALPDDTRVYPGHGGATTIGLERRTNPYL